MSAFWGLGTLYSGSLSEEASEEEKQIDVLAETKRMISIGGWPARVILLNILHSKEDMRKYLGRVNVRQIWKYCQANVVSYRSPFES